jgi:hypothetical protein
LMTFNIISLASWRDDAIFIPVPKLPFGSEIAAQAPLGHLNDKPVIHEPVARA